MKLDRHGISRQLIAHALLGTLVVAGAPGPPSMPPQGVQAEENVTVFGRRFRPAPVPVANPTFDARGSGDNPQDANTGAATGRFGQAYSDAIPDPAKPIDPGAGTTVGRW